MTGKTQTLSTGPFSILQLPEGRSKIEEGVSGVCSVLDGFRDEIQINSESPCGSFFSDVVWGGTDGAWKWKIG